MGACNEGMRKLLMPAEGSHTRDWEGFGDLEEGSLLLLGHVGMASYSQDTTQRLFREGLGAGLAIGATELRLETTSRRAESSTWPGQMYVWVEDLHETWQNCRRLAESQGHEGLVESVVCCHDERKCDALVLREPGTLNVLVLNQAPKGYAAALRKALNQKPCNLVCLMDLLCLVPPGTAAQVAGFYQRFLSCRVSKANDGYRLHFGAGDFLRQTMTFKDDEDASCSSSREVCFYVESEAKFRISFSKLRKAGLTSQDWKAVESSGEFCFDRCVDVHGCAILDLKHIIRSPRHVQCPVRGHVDMLMGA